MPNKADRKQKYILKKKCSFWWQQRSSKERTKKSQLKECNSNTNLDNIPVDGTSLFILKKKAKWLKKNDQLTSVFKLIENKDRQM